MGRKKGSNGQFEPTYPNSSKIEFLEHAIATAFQRHSQGSGQSNVATDNQEFSDAAKYVLDDIDPDLLLELVEHGDHTLAALAEQPVVPILSQAALELLGVETDAVILLSDFIEGYKDLSRAQQRDEADSARVGGEGAAFRKGKLNECELCERRMMLTAHHLIPRETHDLLEKRGVFSRREMQTRLAMLCRPCHSAVHRQIPFDQLATQFNTIDALLEHEGIYKWARYASNLKEKDERFVARDLKEKR